MTKTLELLDPTSLTLGTNVRHDTKLAAPFVASIKARGVLEPVLAHLDPDGNVVVDQGQRRTLAAVKAKLATIPVLVDDQPPVEGDRLVDQWVENEHREDLTNTERAHAVEQLALLGVPLAQIAKRLSAPIEQVTAAAAVAGSKTALQHADGITLEQAAALVEFEDDEAVTADLVSRIERGFDISVPIERYRQDREEAELVAAEGRRLADEGLTVIAKPDWNDKSALPLTRLTKTGKQHAETCPGRVVWVETERKWGGGKSTPVLKVVHGCKGWAKHGHTDAWSSSGSSPKKAAADMTEKERAAASAERRHVIESNKDWKASTAVRRRWLAQFLQRKTAPDGAETLVAAGVVGGWTGYLSSYNPGGNAYDLLGTSKDALDAELATAGPKRALQIALALTIAAWEVSTSDQTWRSTDTKAVRTLAAIAQWGHTLSDIETRIVDGTAATPA